MNAATPPTLGVRTLTFGRHERRNVLDRATLEGIATEIDGVDPGITGAVVLRSDGDTFSAGADLREVRGDMVDLQVDERLRKVRETLQTCPVPVIAAVQGGCYGAAVDLAAACDLVVAGPLARFSLPAASLGILYDPCAIASMARRFRAGFLARLFLDGEPIGVDDAAIGGLVDVRVESEPSNEAHRIAKRMADAPSAAVQATIEVLRAVHRPSFDATHYDAVRRSLLGSPERARVVRQARQRLGIDGPDVDHADTDPRTP